MQLFVAYDMQCTVYMAKPQSLIRTFLEVGDLFDFFCFFVDNGHEDDLFQKERTKLPVTI